MAKEGRRSCPIILRISFAFCKYYLIKVTNVRNKILIVATVPETFTSILKGQPNYLNIQNNVEIVTSPDAKSRSIDEGVKVHYVPMVRGINPLKDIVSVLKMVFLLSRERPLAVHSYTPKAGLVTMLAAWICRVPVRIHTFTGLIFPTQKGFKKSLLIWIDRLICACATRVVPEGEGVKKDLVQYKITRRPLSVIGHGNIAGVDVSFFDPGSLSLAESSSTLKSSLNITSGDVVYCFVGRLNKDKGLKELALAFSALPAHAHLIIVGDMDDSAPIDGASMNFFQSHPRVHLLGFQQDIRTALLSSDILVLPSYREGFPNVVLQGGAMGLPCIVTDISGCNEIIEPGFNGWLVPPQDHQGLTDAMLESLSSPPDLLSRMGRNARQRVVSRFNRKDHLLRMANFYKEELNV
ncbi:MULTISPECIES: glycosyltransferase family 4 protein [Pseudomonas]|uniref:glycosyltransferase family 4 protein n=1 Tax=Pseudomonas TaxID=286 RepID=UPI001295F554|nr:MULTISPECIES: glycosyltransferase family 4 protein [Pseudomonas]